MVRIVPYDAIVVYCQIRLLALSFRQPWQSFRLDPKFYNGGTFTIFAPNASANNRYVRKAMLNGKNLDRMWLTTAEVSGGGVLELDMGDTPDTARTWHRPPDVSGVLLRTQPLTLK